VEPLPLAAGRIMTAQDALNLILAAFGAGLGFGIIAALVS
jgi:hypothetical protein